MARIRTIKPEFARHYELYQTEKETGLPLRAAFPCFWMVADREGRFKWQPEVLKLDILPFDPIDFNLVLEALEKIDLIRSYTVNGKKYGYIPTFLKHQVINIREQKSILPAPSCESTEQAHETHVHAHDLYCGEEEEEEEEELKNTSYFSAELKKPSSTGDEEPAVITIPLVTKDSEFPISTTMLTEWQSAYPCVDVMQELRNIRQWNIANPKKQKTKAGIMRHVNTWLADKQNRGGNAIKKGSNGNSQTGFNTLITTGDRKIDISLTNAMNWAEKNMEGVYETG